MLAATILGSGMAFIDGTVVNVALPAIGQGLGATASAAHRAVNVCTPMPGALALAGALFLLPFELIGLRGYSPAEAGAAFLPFSLLTGLLSRPSAGWRGASGRASR